MNTIAAIGLSAVRQLATTLATVILPTTSNHPHRGTPSGRPRPHPELADDVSGAVLPTDQVQTVHFGLDGTAYSIDLSPDNAAALRGDLAPWVKQAHRRSHTAGTSRTRRPTPGATPGPRPTTTIREWARANGHTVSDRGRLSTTVTRAYHAAH
jgi:hypothetical protein